MEDQTQSAALQIFLGFVSGPPIWVWPLLVLLLFVGWRASKPRHSSVILFYFLPLLGVMSMQSIAALAQPAAAWAAFAISYFCATLYFYHRQGQWLIAKSGRKITLAGEWVTMTAVMVVFWSNFVKGTAEALAPQMVVQTGFCVVFSVIVGLAAGSFLGRSVKILMATDSSAPAVG